MEEKKYHHGDLTFSTVYAWSENFILPISHDEVVHGKGSMLAKMPGSEWEKFANLRAYYGYMWGFPGKKLLFMGCEFAQGAEWNHDMGLDWGALEHAPHAGVQRLVRDLNRIYRETPALHARDCEPEGFRWIANYPEQSLTAFTRQGRDGDAPVMVVCNFTPVERRVRLGVPVTGFWREILNSDAAIYGGGDRGNLGGAASQSLEWDGLAQSIEVTVPPLATLFLQHDDDAAA